MILQKSFVHAPYLATILLTGGDRAGDLVVVVRLLGAVLVEAVGLLEEEHDVGRLRQVRLHPRRLELGQVLRDSCLYDVSNILE